MWENKIICAAMTHVKPCRGMVSITNQPVDSRGVYHVAHLFMPWLNFFSLKTVRKLHATMHFIYATMCPLFWINTLISLIGLFHDLCFFCSTFWSWLNTFNASFSCFVFDLVIGVLGICNGSWFQSKVSRFAIWCYKKECNNSNKGLTFLHVRIK